MHRTLIRTLAAGTLLGAVACSQDGMNGPDGDAFSIMGSAFNTAPVGMENTATSYNATGTEGLPWEGPGRGFGRGMGGIMGGREMMGGPGEGGLMGGGLEASYSGEMAMERGPHRGPFGGGPFGSRGGPGGVGGAPITADCPIAANGDITCTTTKGGLTIKTVYAIKDASGKPQTKVDSLTTNAITTTTTVTGTTTRGREGEVTATVNNTSTRSVTGLAPSSAQRTVNGTSTGTETSSGTNRDGKKFTSKREAEDKTEGVVIPNAAGPTSYPKAGKVTRTMTVTATVDGSTTTKKRTETLTYDGSATAKLVINDNGTIKNCTLTLPRGKPSCS